MPIPTGAQYSSNGPNPGIQSMYTPYNPVLVQERSHVNYECGHFGHIPAKDPRSQGAAGNTFRNGEMNTNAVSNHW